jgi:hypothetical protein
MNPARDDARYGIADRHGDYLYEHLDREEAFRLLDLDAWPGQLVPLHRVGCTPDQLAEYRAAGIAVDAAIAFRQAGWDAGYVAATGASPQDVLGYLRLGITDICHIRRLAAAGAGAGPLTALTRGAWFGPATAGLEPLDRAAFTLEGAFGPVRLVFEDGILRAATEADRDDLDDEMTTGLLGGRLKESPALRLVRLMAAGLDAPWPEVGALLGVRDDSRTLALRWVMTILGAPTSRHDGVRPNRPVLPPPPPCEACERRAAFITAREAAYPADCGLGR